LKYETLQNLNIDLGNIEFASNDTINEEQLYLQMLECDFKDELLVATLQMAIIGFGGRSYNQYKYNGELKELKNLFKKFNVHFENSLGDRLETISFTPRRLLRLFRYQIRDYLIQNEEVASYIFTKYTDMDLNYRTTCFPGAEHLVENNEQAKYLLNAYKNLDRSLDERHIQSGILERVKRVLLARNFNVIELLQN